MFRFIVHASVWDIIAIVSVCAVIVAYAFLAWLGRPRS